MWLFPPYVCRNDDRKARIKEEHTQKKSPNCKSEHEEYERRKCDESLKKKIAKKRERNVHQFCKQANGKRQMNMIFMQPPKIQSKGIVMCVCVCHDTIVRNVYRESRRNYSQNMRVYTFVCERFGWVWLLLLFSWSYDFHFSLASSLKRMAGELHGVVLLSSSSSSLLP